MDEFLDELQEYILDITDVKVDGNCDYRAIAITLG